MPWYIDAMPRKNQIAGHYGIYLKKGNKNDTITWGDAMNQAEKREYVVDGSQIRYQMRKTTPRAKRLTPYEREEVLETYHNGAPIEVLAEQYAVKIDTIRYLIKNEAKQREAK